MILSIINPVPIRPVSRSISQVSLPSAPPPPFKLLPAARLDRFAGVSLPAPNFDRTPFERRVELPLAQFWNGRMTISGFHSNLSYSAAALGDPYIVCVRLAPGSAGPQHSRSYGLRITFSTGSPSSTGRDESRPH
jgi:hypothetical protein